jgi:flavin reductase (DIM6/NTAB) family NADH-FMN oxidoreductase RutF
MPDDFQRFVGAADFPMDIVTAAAGGEADGALVGFAMQCSIQPEQFLAGMSVANHTTKIAERAETLAVHLIPESRRDLAELFGGTTMDDGVDKLGRVDWTAGPGGAPVLADLPSHLVGRIRARVDWGGDHVGYVLDPVETAFGDDGPWLCFEQAKTIEPGHPDD